MKKGLFIVLLGALMASCSATMPKPAAKLVSSATHSTVNLAAPVVTPVIVDLDVSPTKVSFFYLPSKTVVEAGYENVVDSAVREALASNGDADVMVALETQTKYNAEGKVESITVTGYPAKYVNFRSGEYVPTAAPQEAAPEEKAEGKGSLSLGGFKLGK